MQQQQQQVRSAEGAGAEPAATAPWYDAPAHDVPEVGTGLLGVICKVLCCSGKHQAADSGTETRTFPRTTAEFTKHGAAWATSALRQEGLLAADNYVTSCNVSDLGASGLISELCAVTLEYASPPVQELPSDFVVKFSPPLLQTRLPAAIFQLIKTEYLAYRKLVPHLPASIKRPRMWCGDFNYTSNKICIMLEKLSTDTFIDFDWPAQPNDKPPKPGYPEKEPKMSHFEKMMDTMAVWHSHHWPLVEKPGLSWINRADGPAYALIEGETKKAWGTLMKVLKGDPPFAGYDGGIPQQLTEMVDAGLLKNITKLQTASVFTGWTSVVHGDVRCDNWYFDGDDVGLIDYQLMFRGNVCADITWITCLNLPISLPNDERERLLKRYFSKLQELDGAPGKTYDDFKTALALAHIYTTLAKAAIGAKGCDMDDPKGVRLMDKMVAGCLKCMELDDSYGAFAQFMEESTAP
eukprot:COSAG01_NODE_31_length_35900_cov_44.332169_14_plen_465_part_00